MCDGVIRLSAEGLYQGPWFQKSALCLSVLDAAAPGFEKYGVHVVKEDSSLTIAVHTSAGWNVAGGKVGMIKSVGHIDFFPNGGRSQPACSFWGESLVQRHAPLVFLANRGEPWNGTRNDRVSFITCSPRVLIPVYRVNYIDKKPLPPCIFFVVAGPPEFTYSNCICTLFSKLRFAWCS